MLRPNRFIRSIFICLYLKTNHAKYSVQTGGSMKSQCRHNEENFENISIVYLQILCEIQKCKCEINITANIK